MQEKRKAIAKKSAVLFIAAMIFFTFASRSIHYFMTPKVISASVDSGYIRTKHSVKNVDVYSQDTVPLGIPFKLSEPIDVIRIHIRPGSMVERGDSVVTFGTYSFNKVYADVEEELQNRNTELLEFEKAYGDRRIQLEKEIQDYKGEIKKFEDYLSQKCTNVDELKRMNDEITVLEESLVEAEKKYISNKSLYESGAISKQAYEKSFSELDNMKKGLVKKQDDFKALQKSLVEEYDSRKKDTEFKLDKSEKSLQYLVDTGILNGKTSGTVKERLDELDNAFSVLNKIKEENYTIVSPTDGLAGNIHIENSKYGGLDTILNIIPKDTVPCVALFIEDINENLDEANRCTLNTGQEELLVKFSGTKVINRQRYMLFKVNKHITIDYKSLMSVNSTPILETKGLYCNMIIPNSAIIERDKVYVLEERKGFWGDEYYASRQKVRIGQYNEHYSEIIGGLFRRDRVITGWDRELADGGRVMIPID